MKIVGITLQLINDKRKRAIINFHSLAVDIYLQKQNEIKKNNNNNNDMGKRHVLHCSSVRMYVRASEKEDENENNNNIDR
jgi:hypothetical protein